MTKLLDPVAFLEGRRQYGVWNDFLTSPTDEGWELTAPDGGTATISDGTKGILVLDPSDATVADNDEVYYASALELFKFAEQKPLVVESLLKFAEANGNNANVISGVIDAVGENTLLDNGGGPKAGSSLACFYKVDGENIWRVRSGVGANVKTTVLDEDGALDKRAHIAGGASFQRLRIEVHPESLATAVIDFFIGVRATDNDWAMTHVAKHYAAISGATEMQVFAGIKNGGAAKETLLLDYLGAEQLR